MDLNWFSVHAGHRSDFVLPDRTRYVDMQRHFLQSYMQLLIHTCHSRGALATGGMAATLLPPAGDGMQQEAVVQKVVEWVTLQQHYENKKEMGRQKKEATVAGIIRRANQLAVAELI